MLALPLLTEGYSKLHYSPIEDQISHSVRLLKQWKIRDPVKEKLSQLLYSLFHLSYSESSWRCVQNFLELKMEKQRKKLVSKLIILMSVD